MYALEDLPDVLRSGEVVVLPFDIAEDGDAEGLGLTALEAMACGVPVIVGDVPAIHDVVEHEVTGLIVDPRDPDALTQEILRLLRSPELRSSLAEAGRDHAKRHFDWGVCAQRYTDIFQRLND
jgi:glycosyltransferase involved in cell wall biosynthesis